VVILLKFELINDSRDIGKRYLYSFNRWQESNLTSEIFRGLDRVEIADKLRNKMIKITCDNNKYFQIEKIKGSQIQYTGSSDSNDYMGNLYLYRDKPRELYIGLNYDLISMKNGESLYREYLLKVVSDNDLKVEYHGIVVTLTYKNKGKIDNDDFDIDVSVYSHELKTVNLTANTIDISFLSVLAYFIISTCINGKIDTGYFGYAVIAIILTYLIQLISRTIYTKNTYLNKIYKMIFKKHKSRFTYKEFKNRVFESYNKAREEDKNKKLTDL